MQAFITEDFLLSNDVARELYHDHAKPEPIFDYHCHLPPDQIAQNKKFRNLYEVWLAGDHYKWRAMRSNGVPEKYCTGDASDWEKFLAYARTVPHTLRNPLYHWTHIELKRFFGINQRLDEINRQGNLGRSQPEARFDARESDPRIEPRHRRVHDGRSDRFPGASPEDSRRREAEDARLSGVATGQGAGRRPTSRVERVGG